MKFSLYISQNYIKYLYIILALIVAVSLSSCSASNTSLKEQSNVAFEDETTISLKDLHTEGNIIVNTYGDKVVLKGVNALDPLAQATWGEEAMGTWDKEYFKSMTKFGAQVVRLPLHPQTWRETSNRFEILDKTISWIQDFGMYVIIDFHSIGFMPEESFEEDVYRTSKTELLEFWSSIASRYKDNPAVAMYDIFNEPVNLKHGDLDYDTNISKKDWILWRAEAQDIINTIRKIDSDTIVLVGGLHWSYDLTNVIDYPINDKSIAYSVHPYPGTFEYLPWDTAFGKVSKIYPVFAGEIGFWGESEILNLIKDKDADSDTWNPVYLTSSYRRGEYVNDILSYLQSHDIGWTAWNFSPAWGPVLLQNWEYDLSRSGNKFHDYLIK